MVSRKSRSEKTDIVFITLKQPKTTSGSAPVHQGGVFKAAASSTSLKLETRAGKKKKEKEKSHACSLSRPYWSSFGEAMCNVLVKDRTLMCSTFFPVVQGKALDPPQP